MIKKLARFIMFLGSYDIPQLIELMTEWGGVNSPFWGNFDVEKRTVITLIAEIEEVEIMENFVSHYKTPIENLYQICSEKFPEIIKDFEKNQDL